METTTVAEKSLEIKLNENNHSKGREVKGKRGKNKFGKEKKNNDDKPREPYQPIIRDNQTLTKYYEKQNLLSKEEFGEFMNTLTLDLPTAFRVNNCTPERFKVNERIQQFIKDLRDSGVAENHLPKEVEWMPFTYTMSVSRNDVRSHPLLKSFHNFLVNEAEVGHISRQELVSMIPPLLMDLKSDHDVLDMCAAPGSKTQQIIEQLHIETDNPEGLVVANDADYQRCHLLVHQTLKRMPSACTVVINEDASIMPKMIGPDGEPLYFDRILCDVICSGDGTFRKNLGMWKDWSPLKAISLHKLQVSIARRGLELLKEGGLMVYSTCSLNPIEDEAVLAYLLQMFNGSIELVDVSDKLVGLKRSPGVNTWKVLDKDMNEYSKYEDVPEFLRTAIKPSYFPPSEDVCKNLNLNRSFRVFPHQQNTGGFFIAVLKKVSKIDGSGTNYISRNVGKIIKSSRRFSYRDDPFIFIDNMDDDLKNISTCYGIDYSKFKWSNLLTRSVKESNKKGIYYANDRLKSFLQKNEKIVKLVNGGLKLFNRCDKVGVCRYRLMHDGMRMVKNIITQRLLEVPLSDLVKILHGKDGAANIPLEELDSEKMIRDLKAGSLVIMANIGNGIKIPICAWCGEKTVSPFICKEERIHILRLLGEDISQMELDRETKRREKGTKRFADENKGGEDAVKVKEIASS
ncbi:Bacterial Fmu (Sun)/eukaryotic nucleolar NOL1/Nop2p domain and RNA (C5-cytosine) methyltransferase family and tRNA (C5-cytosine) methyltransferase, NCL1 family-containing protein [Strongyloides ratti]|uniref:tRNA (cytosine(34)-C(5))-methyltransferase n=1 Tax=Strongyloides ratti TaxID=34506 RepID=A0A090MX95_STRRB|nr:Bacterial Fmu (Sun)/eukaryotic nucleolar NOL1/Nop2p domain and RNA (C5-cytosine) methyltransferase family and tRNA (C5-cytosine) methyltransferase, NCL1 family-containing protein [Strongyloides ratti]CEF65044.1 Bacterial Fmu (Sun)/eukaryotic nucleolar NOL1/Nop2p domain and RNA (C5-cytosine) methyltransferase family and tRNA (C5-cytosine) methyltransferase, NCL1 family-containing protein [Strongyloides ratti]